MHPAINNFAMPQSPVLLGDTVSFALFSCADFFRGRARGSSDRRELKPGVPVGKAKPVPAHPKTTTVGGFGRGAMLKRASASFPPIVPPSFSRIARRNAHTTQYRAACARIWAMTERRWLRVPQAAVYANMGVGLIRKLIRQRHLRAIDVGRYYVIDRDRKSVV